MEEQRFAVVYLDSANLTADSTFGMKVSLFAYLTTQLDNSFSLAHLDGLVLLEVKLPIPP